MASEFKPAPIPTGRITIDGTERIVDAKGGYIPVSTVKPADLLIDQTVRSIMGWMVAASEQIARLKAHTFEDIGALEALLAEQYGATLGGKKGNMTLTSYDGCLKVQVQVADRLTFGPELQIAKTLLDECLNEWAASARPELQAIVTRAFNTDKEGQINRAEIFTLLRLEIEDARWKEAMRAIRDAIRVEGTQTYIRAYRRESADQPWQAVTIDMAKA
ncbi:MAG: DUF3164 family protein [Tabrizicola flagellatus]|uniref:DUF3164 family protein n=1 Tax=Tabrizicola flagellatus TaxID=2593021 RepID=UPI00391BF905